MITNQRPLRRREAWRVLLLGLIGVGLLLLGWAVYDWYSPQARRPIRFDEQQHDVLRASEPIRTKPPHGRQRLWTFDGEAGHEITVAAESFECSLSLALIDPHGRWLGYGEGNDGLFSTRIHLALPTTGRYTVVVCGTDADQFGTYWLSLKKGLARSGAPDLSETGENGGGTATTPYSFSSSAKNLWEEKGGREVGWSESEILASYQRGIKWAEQEENLRAVSWLNLKLGEYWRERRQWDRAEAHYAKSLAAAEQAGFLYGQWSVALERGRWLTRRKRFDQAIAELQRALELSKKLRGTDETEALARIQLGDLFSYTERADLADHHYGKAKDLVKKSGLPSLLARLHVSLFMMLKDKPESKDEAIASAEKAYALREGLEPALKLEAMHCLAMAHLFLKPENSEEGFRLAAEVRALAQRLGCPDDEVSILNLLSLKYFVLKKVDDMVQTAREAAALTLPNDDDPAPRRIALQVQASGESLKGNHETAIQLCMEALGILESAWARERVEELRRRYLSQSRAICTQLIRNLYALYARRPSREYARQAFDFAERSRSRSLLDQMSNDAIRAALATNVHLLDREQKLLQQISSFQRRWVVHWAEEPMNLDRSLALIDERAKLFAERMELQGEIGRLTQNMGQIAPLSPIRAEEAQRRLLADQPRSAILFYQLGVQESFLIVLTRDDACLFKLPDWKTIAQAANEWRERIMEQQAAKQLTAEQLHAYAKAAYRLYELLLKPAASVIQGRDLIIVATHPIQELPFEALVTTNPVKISTPPSYLMERHTITYAPSISVLALMEDRERQATPGKEILLVGDPVFNNRDPRLANPKEPDAGEAGLLAMNDQPRFRQGLYRLPATEGEVLGIAELGRQHGLQPTLWLGFDANEKNFKAHNLLGYRLVHLATHGVADEQDGNLSAILLSMNQKDGSDGLLTTDEVSRLRLDADLVVLSGCRTGSGAQTKAEGIIGLSRAFIVAGARRVCGSLWRVDDRLTQEFMLTFYTALLDQRLSPSESLRQAKLHFLRQGVAPANWSPFIVVGSPR